MSSTPLERAQRLADDVLFPSAAEVEALGEVPRDHFDLIAREGLYGLFAPAECGGLIDKDPVMAFQVVEALASGCLSTALVWIQHHSAVRSVAASADPAVRETWLSALSMGEVRAGVAQGGLRPGPPSLRARAVPGGYALDGVAPWVTGWGHVDVLLVAARDVDDQAIWVLIEARPVPTLTVSRPDLVAVVASRTVHITFDGHPVAGDRVTGTLPFREWPERDALGLRTNGSLSLGLAGRCCRLLDGEIGRRLAALVDECRAALDSAPTHMVPAARAAAAELASRSATTLVVATGAKAILAGEHAQRLAREAVFLLIFGSRPAIREELLPRVARLS